MFTLNLFLPRTEFVAVTFMSPVASDLETDLKMCLGRYFEVCLLWSFA